MGGYLYLIPVSIASVLPCIAAGIYILSRNQVRSCRKPASQRSVDIFLTRLLNETVWNNTRFVSFQVDCFLFDFRRHDRNGLSKDAQYGFFEFARTLDLSNQPAIVKLYIWLVQHAIDFDLKFRYNKSLPFLYNWQQRKKPGDMKRDIERIGRHKLIAYDLNKDPYALRQPDTP